MQSRLHGAGPASYRDRDLALAEVGVVAQHHHDAQRLGKIGKGRGQRFRDALPDDERRDAWLYRVLVNACYSKLRKEVPRRDRERERLDPDGGPLVPADASPEVRAERSAVADALTSTLDDLPESLRVVVVLRYYADLSEREIAIAIRRRPGTVKSRLHEARRRLAADARLAAFASDASDAQVGTR